ncbi:MAG: ABC transporter ATP-binding protein [Alphaproteobacteria bacterium]|nr:ABC transporter ATP-binding protein [Alphaproteobacteria bacterium]
MAETLVAAAALAKSFRNGVAALAGIDLTVSRGEFVGVLGPSGCGKSTLLRILAGLAEPTAGRLDRGTDVAGRVGFVFQEPTLMPWATVWANVYLPLRLRGVGRDVATPRIGAMLDSLGLGEFARAYPRQLSGGMRMRVSIARALVTEPALLLLDEPFAALDEITRFKLNEDLRALWRNLRCTIVFVTHSVFESVFLTNRIVVMTKRPGRIVADLPVNLPETRDAGLRLAPVYSDACRAVSAKLAEAMV